MDAFAIRKSRIMSLLLSFLLIAAMIVFFAYCGAMNNNIPLLAAGAACGTAAVTCLIRYMVVTYRLVKRIKYVAFEELNPEKLEIELPIFLKTLGRDVTAQTTKNYYRSLPFMLNGTFGQALELISVESPVVNYMKRDMAAVRALCNLRVGRIADAERDCNQWNVQDSPLVFGDQAHAIGLYYLENNVLDQAGNYLDLALKGTYNTRWTLANIEFDLARLEEKEGNTAQAIEHYNQAAAIGPKTWMGQESARRAKALEDI